MSSMQNNNEIADILSNFCLGSAYKFYPRYSGRGMYGQSCIGIAHAENTVEVISSVAIYLLENVNGIEKAKEILSHLKDARQDNMGLRTITYWPGIAAASRKKSRSKNHDYGNHPHSQAT